MFAAAPSPKDRGGVPIAMGRAATRVEGGDGRRGAEDCARGGGRQSGHGGVSGRPARKLLFSGSEYALAGGASGDGACNWIRSGPIAVADRSGRRSEERR